jgi:hypothetical protein
MLMTRSPTGGDDRRYAEAVPQECSEQVQADRTPEFLDRGLDDRVVRRCRSTRIVVEGVQTAKVPHCGLDCRFDTLFLTHVGRDRNALSAGLGYDLRRLFTRYGVYLSDDNPGTLRRHGPRGGAAGPGASDQSNLSIWSCHSYTSLVISV